MTLVMQMVFDQITDAFRYLPGGCAWAAGVGIVIAISRVIYKYFFHKRITQGFWWKLFLICILTVYGYCLLQLTLLSRQRGIFGGVDWRLFGRWNENSEQKAFLIANIIMFIPLGILLPMAGKWMRHILLSLPTAMACSIGIEAVQLKYWLGYCQLDDVVANSTGFLIGFLIYLIIYDVYSLFRSIVMALREKL